jgi:hypothetical protein
MRKINSIIMHAPKVVDLRNSCEPGTLAEDFAASLSATIRYLERSPDRNVVVMAATRSGIPISWISEQIIDRDCCEIRFPSFESVHKRNARSLDISDASAGVLVEIKHDLAFSRECPGANRRQNHWRLFHSQHCKQNIAPHEGIRRGKGKQGAA